ncbi:MAG: SPOR domain-containing protein [Gammaproteobacteria bacterium HGW-Gammaproteobacteria-3]|nr:MAG: SPOR domain-containing protein [Gammaproteobacteria bacterium HGW-Gammaproteobacteria-3]
MAGWKWLLSAVLTALFAAFLLSLRHSEPEQQQAAVKKAVPVKPKKPEQVTSDSEQPRFDFYTILPKKEVVVPDYEIKTRVREERVGKAKPTQYILQAGSFRDFKEADSLRAKLALMGIESRIEKAKIGAVTWNRVKMGPYAQMSSVATIKTRLKQNGIDVMVTESGG